MIETKRNWEKENFDLRQLIEISKSLNSTLEFHTVLESILYTCLAQMQVLQAGIFTRRDIQSSALCLHRNAVGFDITGREVCIDDNSSLFRLLEERRQCFSISQLLQNGLSEHEIVPIGRHAPALVIPVLAKSQLIGIIILGNRIDGSGEFSLYEQSYLMDLAALAGTALHNAFLFEVTNTDLMTRLKMRHYFLTMLEEAIARCNREGGELTMAMLDLDRFKEVNDTHGHVVGDEVLKDVAQVLLGAIRQTDIAARYGGEEFVLLLPHTRLGDAQRICDRIRESIAERHIQVGDTRLKVTISIGVAEYNAARDHTSHMFIDRADQALYLSKRNGRNLVTLSE